MLCTRCGAVNGEAAPLCGNCGASLKRQSDLSTASTQSGQAGLNAASSAGAFPIDELPTAHMPGVSMPSETSAPIPPVSSPVSHVTSVEPDERSASVSNAPAPGADSPAVLAPPGILALPSRSKTPGLLSQARSTPPTTPFPGGMAPSSQPGVNVPSPAQSGMNISTPGEGNPPSRPGMETQFAQSGERVPASEGANMPLQPDMGGQLARPATRVSLSEPGNPPLPPEMITPPLEVIRPLSQPGVQVENIQPAPATVPPPQRNASGPPSQPGMYASPNRVEPGWPSATFLPLSQGNMGRLPSQPGLNSVPQIGGNVQGRPGQGNYQVSPFPAFPANNAPGQSQRGVGPASQGGTTPSSGQPAVAQVHAFVKPLPRWIVVAAPIAGVTLLTGLTFVNADWATGATISAIIAVILTILLGIAAGVRMALGMLKSTNPHRRAQIIGTALLALLFLLYGCLGISQQSNLHIMQGRYLEGQQQWSAAIAQYQAGGEKSSSSVDVARTYNKWGKAQTQQQNYGGAVASFSAVITHYQQVPKEFNQARASIIVAYQNWADQAFQQQDYAGAVAHYNALLSLAFCDTNCSQDALSKNATAYYHLAEQQLAQQHYIQAVDAYQALTNRFPRAPETRQIHVHYAQALWGKGQQILQSACPDALSAYRLLARLFSDTDEGRRATAVLKKPVQVKGHFTQSVPGAPYHPTAYLVRGLVVGIQQYQFPPLLAHAPSATIHSDGSFSFSSVSQGIYELVWSSDNTLHFYYAYSGKQVLYVAHPGPLCAYDLGDINQDIPAR